MPASEATAKRPLATLWELPDELWERIEPILGRRYPPARTGRPRADLRLMLDGIIFRMPTGCQWNQLPERFGPDSTLHDWFQRFVTDGALEEIWAELVRECAELGAVDWEWQAADGVIGKSRFEGDKRGPNPTDRAKPGTKKSIVVEAGGGPLGVAIDGANVHDTKLLERTIAAIVVERPDADEVAQHLCLDKAYDNDTGWGACIDHGYTPHIALIRDDRPPRPKTHKPRRWVVERTLAWLSKCRGILIRWEKKAEHYLGLLQFACGLLWFRRLHHLTAT